jgi:hypothetical protein
MDLEDEVRRLRSRVATLETDKRMLEERLAFMAGSHPHPHETIRAKPIPVHRPARRAPRAGRAGDGDGARDRAPTPTANPTLGLGG